MTTEQLAMIGAPLVFLFISILVVLIAKAQGYKEWYVLLAICNMAGNICFMSAIGVFPNLFKQLIIAYIVYAVVVVYITLNIKGNGR